MEHRNGTVFNLAWFSNCCFRLSLFDGTLERNSFQAGLVLRLLIQTFHFWWNIGTKLFSGSPGSLTFYSGFLFLLEQLWNKTVFKLAWFFEYWFGFPIFDGTVERNSFQGCLLLLLLIQSSYFWRNEGTEQFSSWLGSLTIDSGFLFFWWNSGTEQFLSRLGSLTVDSGSLFFDGTVEWNSFQE